MLALSRTVWVVTGLAWAAVSLLSSAHPNYWDPVTTLDWASIWLYSAAWLLLAPAVLLMGRLVASREVRTLAVIVAAGALATGIANGLEDGLEVSSLGPFYVLGFFVGSLGLLVLATSLAHARRPRLGWLSVAIFLGVFLFLFGGGLIVLAAFGSLAVAPSWFQVARPVPSAAVGSSEAPSA